jgi:hypothetical protein
VSLAQRRSNSKYEYETMDKTPSYAWENPQKVMENEISEPSSPVITRTSKFSRKVMDNEISKSSSSVFTRTSTLARKVMVTGEDDSNISLSITFLETVDVRVKSGEDDSDISLSITYRNHGHQSVQETNMITT